MKEGISYQYLVINNITIITILNKFEEFQKTCLSAVSENFVLYQFKSVNS